MQYSVIQPITYKPHREMTNDEATAYFDWFIKSIPERERVLETAVKSSSDIHWEADETENSLHVLGQWFFDHIGTRARSQDDQLKEAERLGLTLNTALYEGRAQNWSLTNEAYSLAIDIGMYLGRVLIRNHNRVKWKLATGPKTDIDHHQPVLVGLSNIQCNPVQLMIALAYGFASKKQLPSRLLEIYKYWSASTD